MSTGDGGLRRIHPITTIVLSHIATELGVEVAVAATLSEAEAPSVISELADLPASGAIELAIAATHPLDRVAEAFERHEQRHAR